MRTALSLLALLALACGNGAPSILPVKEQKATVGVALEIDVSAVDPDDDDLTFSLKEAPIGASITKVGKTAAKFRWVPSAAQTDVTGIDIVASDGSLEDTEKVPIVVEAGEGSGPVFTSNAAFVIDLARSPALRFDILVKDDGSNAITFTEVVPIPRAQLKPKNTATPAKKATFTWEPDLSQRGTPSWIYTVRATNDFGQTKDLRITILIRGGGACPGTPSLPVIALEAVGTLLTPEGDYAVSAEINDNTSILKATLRWALGESPSPATFTEVDLVEEGGNFTGAIPKQTLGPGEGKTITYQVCALDDDDPTTSSPDGDDPCDNSACSPLETFVATAPGGLCQGCASDASCGSGNFCITGLAGEKFCGRAVGGGCPTGYVSKTPPGKSAAQCVPYACTGTFTNAGCSCLGPMPGELVINELFPVPKDAAGALVDVNGDGVKSAVHDEYVELLNVSDRTLLLSGLKLFDLLGEVAALTSVRIAPGRAALVFGGGDTTRFKSFPNATVLLAAPARGLALNDSGAETVRLFDGRTDIDRVSYTAPATLREAYGRATDGAASRTLAVHSSLAGSEGAKLSPGAQQCGSPFPLSEFPCGRTCTTTDTDQEPNNDRTAASCLATQVTGRLAFKVRADCAAGTDYSDWYSFEGTAGSTLHASTHATASGDIYDTILKLYGPGGQLIAQGDDCATCAEGSPDEFYSTVQVPLPSDGTYYLQVEMTEYSDCAGNYRLEARLQ